MEEATKKTKLKKGCWVSLLKVIGVIIAVYLIEYSYNYLFNLCNKEDLSVSLLPFHNNYFVFEKYFLTEDFINSGDAESQYGTYKFILFYVVGYVFYMVISLILLAIPKIKKYYEMIITPLFYAIFVFAFLLAFFFPNKKSIIDLAAKEITVTKYDYYFIPTTFHIPFNSINKFSYRQFTIHYLTQKTESYGHFIAIEIEKKTGEKIKIGDMKIEDADASSIGKGTIKPSAELMKKVEHLVLLLNSEIKK